MRSSGVQLEVSLKLAEMVLLLERWEVRVGGSQVVVTDEVSVRRQVAFVDPSHTVDIQSNLDSQRNVRFSLRWRSTITLR